MNTTAFYNKDGQIVLSEKVEDGIYYFNGGYQDANQWNGINLQVQDKDLDGTRFCAIAKYDQLGHIERHEYEEWPVYEFVSGVGTYKGHYIIGYFEGRDEVSTMTEEEMVQIDIFAEYTHI